MQQVEKRSKDKEISTVRKRTRLPDKLKEDQMKDRFWAVSPLDYRYYGADKEVFERLNPYVSERAFIKYQLTVEAALAKQLAHKDWHVCTKEQANEIIQACKQVTTSEVMEEERSLHHVVRALYAPTEPENFPRRLSALSTKRLILPKIRPTYVASANPKVIGSACFP